ncbi:hypothetical protein EVAR_101570_1 [Eumeta japonica]|uniref:Uncharacterized protein n=1 Tax=Eumeta variegata TaxID=151549 RepID=A0A4C1STW0_EUMVA|nr:hypothetical protein EVAR_101570_1 [Eumeta japonica]
MFAQLQEQLGTKMFTTRIENELQALHRCEVEKDACEERAKSLNERLQALEISEQKLRVQLTQTESLSAGRLQAAAERENELSERLKQLTKEIDKLRALKESNERELKEKLNLSNDEVAVLRTSRRSLKRVVSIHRATLHH